MTPPTIRPTTAEAVAVASGNSPTAETLRAQLGASSLGLLVGRDDIDLPTKQRLAWVRETLTANEVRQDRLYLARLAELGFTGELRRAAEEVLAAAHVEGAPALVRHGFLRLWPHRHGTDGFFAAVWQRS
mgnify:CR=1 FL=1